jgi:hypothetical protein
MQATSDRPRFRQDLVAEPIEDGANRFIDVMDPDTGTLFRFFEVEYSLACAMDGQRDVAGIVKWADEELGLKTNAKEVSTVIATLGELGYLERGAAAAAAAGAAAAAAPAVQPPKTPTPPVGIKKVPEQPALNRWDAPTAMGDVDEYLERGVVHASNRSNTPAPDVELGQAGTRTSQSDELPRAPNLELGAPGATAAARPAGKVEDIALGAPGKSASVEVDLAADVPLSPAAVKEAVRQSQVMSAVNVPPELAAELDKKPEAKPEPKVEAKPEPKVEAKPAAKAEPKVEAKPAKPEVKPEPRPAEPKAPPAPSSGVSPVLIAAVIIAVLAAGGFAVWKFVINKKDAATDTSAVKPPPPPQPEPPPPPPVETAKLATEAPVAKELKPSAPGQIATIVASDTAVKEGDPIARLVGFKPLEGQVAALDKSLAKAKDAIAAAEKERDAAQTAGNKNGVTAAEKKLATAQKTLADQEAKLATAKAALDKFLIKSPGAGKITAVAKPNAKVTPTDVIATLTREPTLVATFKSAGEVAVGTRVLLAIKGSDQKLSCTVAQTGGDGVKVACPKDAASDGTEVTYAGVDPNAPSAGATPAGDAPKAGEPAAGPAGSGATGSAEAPAPAGSAAGSAAAGSAAADEAKPEEHKADDKKPEESADKPAEKKRPRSRPRATPTPADKGSAGSGGDATAGSSDTPADKPADPAPAPAPTPAGSAAP